MTTFYNNFVRRNKEERYSSLVDNYSAGIQQVFSTMRYKEFFSEWVNLPPGPKKILDIGCGDGLFTNFLQEEYAHGIDVIGIDNSKEMIEFAQAKHPAVDFRLEDMDHMSVPDRDIDFIFSRFAIHFSEDLPTTLTEAGRVAKPGCLFFLKDVHPFYATFLKNSLDYEKKERAVFKTQGDTGVSVIHPTFTFEEYSHAFTVGGWRIKGIHEIYGKDAKGEKVTPYRVPTSVCFILVKE